MNKEKYDKLWEVRKFLFVSILDITSPKGDLILKKNSLLRLPTESEDVPPKADLTPYVVETSRQSLSEKLANRWKLVENVGWICYLTNNEVRQHLRGAQYKHKKSSPTTLVTMLLSGEHLNIHEPPTNNDEIWNKRFNI